MLDKENNSELRDLSLKTDALINEFNGLSKFKEYESAPRVMKSRKTAIFTEQHYEEDAQPSFQEVREVRYEPEIRTKRFPKKKYI